MTAWCRETAIEKHTLRNKYLLDVEDFPLIVVVMGNEPLPLKPPVGDLDLHLGGELTRLIVRHDFTGERNESVVFSSDAAKNHTILLFGSGHTDFLERRDADLFFINLKQKVESLNMRRFLLVKAASVNIQQTDFKKYLSGLNVEVCDSKLY